MGRTGKRKLGSDPRPVKNIFLSDKDRKMRVILLVVLLAIAVVGIATGISAALTTEPGWSEVESTSAQLNVSSDFVLNYCYGLTEEKPTAEKKRLTMLYTDAVNQAWEIFYDQPETICENVNQAVTVDPALYSALTKVKEQGSRYLYLGPVYAQYYQVFVSENEPTAETLDPGQDPETKEYVAQLAAYAADSEMVDIQLLENNQVKLVVSEAYQAFAREHEITQFLDLGWMTNAFVTDFLADCLMENGFTNGYISSYDGFTRNLNGQQQRFSLNLFDRIDSTIYLAGAMEYDRPAAIVFLRDYPISQMDKYHYYTFESGRVVTTFADLADGQSKSATDSLVSYSYDSGCADILLRQSPVFIADAFDLQALENMKDEGIFSIWFEGTTLCCNDSALTISLNPESAVAYTVSNNR